MRLDRPGGPRRVSAAASSTPTRRCCRRSRAPTPSATRSTHGVAVTGVHGPPRRRDARRRPDRRPGGRPGPARRRRGDACAPGSRPSSTGCCRGSWRCSWPARSVGRRRPPRARSTSARADARVPVPRRALLSVSDKTGLVDLARGLVARGFELVSTGGTARTLREAGLPVTDVAAVTGSPEMLDGRVKTLHPRVHGGLLADRRLDDHRQQLLAAGHRPVRARRRQPLPVRRRRSSGRASTIDELIEEIDIGGPSMVRAAAKNHANVAIVTVAGALRRRPRRARRPGRARRPPPRASWRSRRSPTPPPTTRGSPPSCRHGFVAAGLLDAPDDPYPPTLTLALEKVETLRYGENPHQPAARYRRPGATARRRPVRRRPRAAPGQGAVVQQRPRRRDMPARPILAIAVQLRLLIKQVPRDFLHLPGAQRNRRNPRRRASR